MQNIKIGSGLHNLGNTCFFNAVMQVMLYTPSLLKDYSQKNHSVICKKDDWCIFCGIQKLWHQSKKSRVVMPNPIVSNLRSIFKKFRLGRQEDSHQFLRYLIEGMQDAQTGKLGKDRQKNQKIINKTTTYHTFGGKMRTFVLCLNCHHKSLTTQRYYDLSIQCQRSNTLQQGLQSYFKVDDLTGANKYRCDNCKQLANAKKGVKIISVPSVVTFQFKRFTNSLRKIGKFIEYPRSLNLNRYLDHQQQPQKSQLQLYGVIVHSGSSAGSGHYYAFVKNGNQWYQMNDSNVSRCTQDRVLRQQAYLLFYGKTKIDKIQQTKTPQTTMSDNEVMVNIKQNGDRNKDIINGNHQQIKNQIKNGKQKLSKSLEKPKQKQNNKKITQIKPFRKQSEQEFEEVKRKLSLDIEQLKEQSKLVKNNKEMKNQNNQKKQIQINGINDKNLNGNHLNNTKLQINGKPIDAPIFGHLLFGNGGKKNQEMKQQKDQSQDEEDIQLQVPLQLQKRRSKQQALSAMNMAQVILNYAEKIANLARKLPRNSHRSLRSVYNLRRFELTSKKRKMGG